MTKNCIISILIVVVVFTTLISGAYVIVIPALLPDYKTPLILIAGVIAAALFGGYFCYQDSLDDTLLVKIIFGLCGAAVVAVLVYFLSLAVIVKIHGS